MIIENNIKCVDIPKTANLQTNGYSYDILFGCYNIQIKNEKMRKMVDPDEKHYYLCILNWKIGIDIASPENTQYNKELLEQCGIDEISAADIAEYIYKVERGEEECIREPSLTELSTSSSQSKDPEDPKN